MKIFLALILLLSLTGCGVLKKKEEYDSYPFVPDTAAYPSLQIYWDRPLDSASVHWLGPYGIWENGGGFDEIAGEIELHLHQNHENIYALTEGIVVDVQPLGAPDPAQPHRVEGLWIRYGRNFIVKYYSVNFPAVGKGSVVRTGQVLGKTSAIGASGFYEVGIYLNAGGSWADCPFPYFNSESQQILLDLWNDGSIGRGTLDPGGTPWCNMRYIFQGDKVNSEYWQDRRKKGT